MKKRILSLLLALCLLVGLLPTAVFAAEPEEALYTQMLELGLVDADGALIENNTFTVADGTRLSSLTALIEWLNQCEEDDLDTRVTVDATGRSATVEQLMYALSTEYQIAGVAGQLNLLASGAYAAALAAGTGAVPAEAHGLRLGMTISTLPNTPSWMKLTVSLYDQNNEKAAAPYDIPVEVGIFTDFLNVGDKGFGDLFGTLPGVNCFERFTIPSGSDSCEFTLGLDALIDNYLSQYNGLWDGNAYLLFQARTAADDPKMPASTATACVSIAPSSTTDPVVNAITGGTEAGMKDDASKTVVPYCQEWRLSENAAEIDDGDEEHYYRIPAAIPAAKGSAYNDPTYGWKDTFYRAFMAGVGNANSPKIRIENAGIWTPYRGLCHLDTLKLYVSNFSERIPLTGIDISSPSFPLDYLSYVYIDSSAALAYLGEVSKAKN